MNLFPPQQDVIKSGILDSNNHCFLNMATGSGKTFLAEFATEKVLKSGYKSIYVTPLRALAEQQASRWEKRFSNYKIGVFTGDTIHKSSTKGCYQSSQLMIMTPERLDACIRNWRSHWNWIPDVSLIVVDEFHILGQPQRGPRLEGTITRFLRLNPFVRVVGLSATIPNTAEISDWLCGAFFSSQWRQVPLQKRIVRFSAAKDKPRFLVGEVRRCIDQGGQSLIFCNSRSRVQKIADYLNEQGISTACHHAGLEHSKRIEVENRFRSGCFRALTATSTLEMGLNLPARQVIIYDSYAYSETGFAPLPVWSFIQRAGRAGRPGLDDSGEVVLMLPKWVGGSEKYLREECEPVISQLTSQKAMTEQILVDVFAGFSRTRKELSDGFLPLTLYKKQHAEAQINGIINKLIFADLLFERNENEEDTNTEPILKVGLLGRLAVKLMFAPDTVKSIKDAYENFDRLYFFDLLLLASMNEDCSPVLQANYEEMDTLCDIVGSLPSSIMDIPLDKLKKKLPGCPGTLRFLASIKMAATCYLLTEGINADDIAKDFDIFTADIHMLQESVVRILLGISAITSAIDKSVMGEEAATEHKKKNDAICNLSSALADMLMYEISSDLVALTHLQGVGGKTAKRLAEHGYETICDIANANPTTLVEIKGVGKKLAASIVKQANELRTNADMTPYTEERIETTGSVNPIKSSIDPYRLRRSLELTLKGSDGGRHYVTGGREDHIVRTHNGNLICDCLDFEKQGGNCKHILCVKRALGDAEVCKMVKRIKEDINHSIRESLPSFWYSVTSAERG